MSGVAEPEWKRCEHHWVWHSGPMIERGISVAQCSLCGHLRADAEALSELLSRAQAASEGVDMLIAQAERRGAVKALRELLQREQAYAANTYSLEGYLEQIENGGDL